MSIYIFSNQSFESIDYLCYPANIRLDEDVLKTPWIHLSSLFSEDVFKTSSRRLDQDEYIHFSHSSSEDVFKTSWSRPIYSSWPYVFKMSWRRFQDVLPRRLQDVLQKRLQDIFKTSYKLSSRCFQSVSSG